MYTLDYFRSFATQVDNPSQLPKSARYYKSEVCVMPDSNNVAQFETVDIYYKLSKGIISKYYFRLIDHSYMNL
jgi:hypothetical protein